MENSERVKGWLQAGPRLFAPLDRVDEDARMVYGVFVTDHPVVDAWGYATVLNWDATKAAVEEWRTWGNVREMHQLQAAGVAREIVLREESHEGYVGVYVADDAAWEKVKNQVYKGFSVGFNPQKWVESTDYEAPIEVVDYEIVEVSLVDRPRDPTARIDLWRAAGKQPEKGGDPVVLQRVWSMVMGETALPDTAEVALELLRAQLAPPAPPAPAIDAETLTRAVAEVEVLATETRGDVDGLREQVADVLRVVAGLQGRLTTLEQTPETPPVQRGGGNEPEPVAERIRKLERTIKAGRLSPQTVEVQELMQLYQEQRRAAT